MIVDAGLNFLVTLKPRWLIPFEHADLDLSAQLLPHGKWNVRLDSSLPAAMHLNAGGGANLPCLDIVAISVSKALLWHTVDARSPRPAMKPPANTTHAAGSA